MRLLITYTTTNKMALLPYTLIEPQGTRSPLVVDSPHSGRIYPVDFAYACPLHLLRQAEDSYVDEIIAGATISGASIVNAEFPRSMIDVNRAETDIDPASIDGDFIVVCLSSGRFRKIARRVFANPISNIISASSSTRICRLSAENPGDSSICCKSRPGVQINTFII